MIALQLYTIRTQLQDPSRLGGVLGRLGEIGYRSVEVAGLGPKTIGRFGEEMRRAELVACAAHVALDRLVDDLDTVAAECNEWGCEYVVVPSLPEEYRSEHGYRRFALKRLSWRVGCARLGSSSFITTTVMSWSGSVSKLGCRRSLAPLRLTPSRRSWTRTGCNMAVPIRPPGYAASSTEPRSSISKTWRSIGAGRSMPRLAKAT